MNCATRRIGLAVAMLGMVAGPAEISNAELITGMLDARVSGSLYDTEYSSSGARVVTDVSFRDHLASFSFTIDTLNKANTGFTIHDFTAGGSYSIYNSPFAMYPGYTTFYDSPVGQGTDTAGGTVADIYDRHGSTVTGTFSITDPTGRYIDGTTTTHYDGGVTLSASLPVYGNTFTGTGVGGYLTVTRAAPDTLATPEPSTVVLAGIAGLCLLGYSWRRRRKAATA